MTSSFFVPAQILIGVKLLHNYHLKEVNSDNFGMSWVQQKESFLYFSFLEENQENLTSEVEKQCFDREVKQDNRDKFIV